MLVLLFIYPVLCSIYAIFAVIQIPILLSVDILHIFGILHGQQSAQGHSIRVNGDIAAGMPGHYTQLCDRSTERGFQNNQREMPYLGEAGKIPGEFSLVKNASAVLAYLLWRISLLHFNDIICFFKRHFILVLFMQMHILGPF